ncbi:MAG: arylamine N-acetyltransferase [Oscillospiraceae bacterium]|nr:arylamine N-acetyltransferase [Oscillospiraceae bacterium]
MNKEKVVKYFKRLGLEQNLDDIKLDAELLKKIQFCHVMNIPYENIDIVNNIPINLDNDNLFEKMIVNNRGGYCFEINSLFDWFLRELGYKTSSFMARYLRGETQIPMRRHRVIAVTSDLINGRILCDAGVGERAPRFPLLIEEGVVQEQFGETYSFEKDEFLGWVLTDFYKGEWKPFFSFTEEKQLDIDYEMPSFYCEKHPDSIFNKKNIIAIKTPTGRKTINDKMFHIFEGNNVTEIIIENEEMSYEILNEHFFIKI